MMGEETAIAGHREVSGFYGWRLIGALWLILCLTFSVPMYGGGVIYSSMAAARHLSASSLGLAFTVLALMTGLPGPAIAWVIGRFGARWTMLAGNLLMACGAIALATLPAIGGAASATIFGVTIGLGVAGGGLLGAQVLAARWFERDRARAMALMFTSAGIGGFFAPAAFNAVIEHFGSWRAGWWLLALLAVISALIVLLTVREFPSDLGQVPDGRPPEAGKAMTAAAGSSWTVDAALRSRGFWTVIFTGAAFNGALTFLLAHSIIHLRQFGAGAGEAAMAIATIAIASLAGKILLGWIGSRVPLRHCWAAAMLLLASGLLLAIHPMAVHGIYLFPVLCGLGIGVSLVCVSALPAELFGARVFAALLGVSLLLQTVASALSPFLAGMAFDLFGGYRIVLIVLAALCGMAAVLLATLRVPAPPVKE